MNSSSSMDVLEKTSELPWHSLGKGAFFKLLRYSEETGVFSIILRIDKGGMFQSHRHLGAAEFLMTKGRMKYVNGVAEAGDWGFEALGAVHEATSVDEDSELLFIGYGPLIFVDENGEDEKILDGKLLQSVAMGHCEPVSFTQ